jgi:hypothetical protein
MPCAIQNSTGKGIFSDTMHANYLKSSYEPLALLNTNADSYTLSSTSFFVEFGLGVTVVRKNIFEIALTIAQDEMPFIPISTV